MGGSNNFKNVDNYSVLAKYYDSLLQDEESLFLWLDYIKKYIKGNKILELASGSGVMANLLKKEGYDVIASDLSKEMQGIAKNNFDGDYLILDMTNFNIDQNFDLILCMVDSINYLNNYESIKNMFNCVYNHLNEKGVFIFDMHHIERLNEFEEEYIEEGYVEGIPYQWTIQSDKEVNALYEHFAFFEDDGIINENHIQYIYDPEILKDIMVEVGFKTEIINEFIEDEKVLMIGEK